MEIPTTEPARLQAGDTIRWRVNLLDYPASDGWTLTYRLVREGSAITIATTADGTAHLAQVSASDSAQFTPGEYTAVRTVTREGERHTLSQFTVTVLADFAAGDPVDARSPARRALDDLRAALRQWLTSSGHVQEYEIAGRRMRFASVDEIHKRIALAQREADAEAAALGLGKSRPGRILVRY